MIAARPRMLLGALLAAVCGGAVLLAAPGAASAAPSGLELDIGNTGSYTANPTTPLITATNFVPGSTVSGVMGVWNTRSVAGSISVQITKPITLAPADSKLPSELRFSLATSTDSGATYSTIWSGSESDLEQGVQVIASLAGNGKELVQLSATLPLPSGNETQGNSFTFGLTVTMTGPDLGGAIVPLSPPTPTTSPPPSGSASVGGVSTSRAPSGGGETVTIPPPTSGAGGQSAGGHSLATTGVDVALLTMIGLLLILCGILLTLRWRTARQH